MKRFVCWQSASLLAVVAASSLSLEGASAQETGRSAIEPVPGLSEVTAAVNALGAQSGAQSGFVGFSLRILNATVTAGADTPAAATTFPAPTLAVHGDKSLLPASTLKTITTGCALSILGPDYQFATLLQSDGEIDRETGTLSGNVFVRGSGDPTLGKDGWLGLFGEWYAALQAAGVKVIEGSIVGDDSLFASQAVSGSWAWDDIGNYYAPPVTALNFHHNTFYISFQPGAVGSLARLVSTSPTIPELEFMNEMRTGSANSGDQGYVYGAPYADTYFLRGSIPKRSGKFTIKGAIPDPAYFCAWRFNAFLKAKGIITRGDPTTARRGVIKTHGARNDLHTHLAKPLGALIKPVNHESLNLDAEALLKAMGVKASPIGSTATGSTATGAKAVADFLKSKGIDTTGFDMVDGCGLSRGNAVTPNQLTAALTLFQALPGAEEFRASLPIAGRTGTLKSIGGGTSAEGRIRAKSGTVHRVKCYAGYVDCRSGKTAAFAIMVHQYSGEYAPIKACITAVMARLAEM